MQTNHEIIGQVAASTSKATRETIIDRLERTGYQQPTAEIVADACQLVIGLNVLKYQINETTDVDQLLVLLDVQQAQDSALFALKHELRKRNGILRRAGSSLNLDAALAEIEEEERISKQDHEDWEEDADEDAPFKNLGEELVAALREFSPEEAYELLLEGRNDGYVGVCAWNQEEHQLEFGYYKQGEQQEPGTGYTDLFTSKPRAKTKSVAQYDKTSFIANWERLLDGIQATHLNTPAQAKVQA